MMAKIILLSTEVKVKTWKFSPKCQVHWAKWLNQYYYLSHRVFYNPSIHLLKPECEDFRSLWLFVLFNQVNPLLYESRQFHNELNVPVTFRYSEEEHVWF